ncbi:MAG: secF, partial [Nevskia sp.]|nr:secF [Nevskia sp.]
RNYRKKPVLDVINLSINQTLLRSIITHFTVLMVLSSLYFFGGKSVHGFAVAMIVGVLVATYSSIYVSSGVTVLLGVTHEDLLTAEEKEGTAGLAKRKAENDGAVV